MKRRSFLYHASAFAGAGPTMLMASEGRSEPAEDLPAVLKRDLLPDRIRIDSLSLFRRDGNWFVRARSADGAEGWAVAHPFRTEHCYPVFTKIVAPFFEGRDARDLEQLIDEVFLSGSHYKMQGQLFWVAVAAAEFAVLDLLGKRSQLSAVELLGGRKRDTIDLYIANSHRHLSPEESLQRIVASVDTIDARAVKFKIGGRMKSTDQVPGRTEALIPIVAEALHDRCTLYADANSSYTSVDKAIQVGRMLEANGFAFYEEPCPFDHLDETRAVADALEIPIAWGEQESSFWRFRKMIQSGGVQIPQPDLFYYGGLIRSLRVAQVAEKAGLDCTPHISGGGLGFLYMGIYAACCPNPGPFQEYKGLSKNFPWQSSGTRIEVKGGSMTAPDGDGIGVTVDPEFLKGATQVP
ncbi:MAG: mandelate racemase/muconate lactonizing enzyme family protein [Verrucomicrobiota bacterium]